MLRDGKVSSIVGTQLISNIGNAEVGSLWRRGVITISLVERVHKTVIAKLPPRGRVTGHDHSNHYQELSYTEVSRLLRSITFLRSVFLYGCDRSLNPSLETPYLSTGVSLRETNVFKII